ncbi:MAG: hypothetical protein V4544_06900 [Pseudomonadota bacterium]
MKLKRILSASLLVLLSTAPFTMGYSATLVENAETSAAARLQAVFTEKQNETIDKVILEKGYFSNLFFPEEYKEVQFSVHERAHLWPRKYVDFNFKHGLLNSLINGYNGNFDLINIDKENVALKSNWQNEYSQTVWHNSRIFCATTKDMPTHVDRRKVTLRLYKAFVDGLHENEHLLFVGSNYLKHKIREEYIGDERKCTIRNLTESQRADNKKERNRGDLLQDLAYTIVCGASRNMYSILNVIKNDKPLQQMVTDQEKLTQKIKKDYLSNLAGFDLKEEQLQIDADGMLIDETGLFEASFPGENYVATYNNRVEAIRVKFGQYEQEIETFFKDYRPTINGVEEAEYNVLELFDFGPENIESVPTKLRQIIDSL